MLLPDGPLTAVTEFAFIGDGGMPFVNAAKHEEVVARHVAKIERLELWIDTVGRTCPSNDTISDFLLGQD
jgi:hypothetical protein